MVEAGDPRRSLRLLWGHPVEDPSTTGPTRRGPRPGLSVAQITAVAIEVADAEGLAGLSMRRVADRLGVGAMSLYTYVPAKAELVDVMVDTVFGQALAPVPAGPWRERLQHLAIDEWRLLRRHPWLLHLVRSRPPLGPNAMARYERGLEVVDGLGLDDVEMDAVLTLVLGFVQGTARAAADAEQAVRRTGLDDAQWWEATGPWLEQVLDPERFPLAVRVGAAAGEAHGSAFAAEHAFEFGLERVLDGVERLVRRQGEQ